MRVSFIPKHGMQRQVPKKMVPDALVGFPCFSFGLLPYELLHPKAITRQYKTLVTIKIFLKQTIKINVSENIKASVQKLILFW